MKRLIILQAAPKKGQLEKNVFVLLDQLHRIATDLVIVTNGEIDENTYCELNRRERISIVERENYGLDFGAYKYVLTECLKETDLQRYNQLVLCNDTIYGFFAPLETIFEEMSAREVDYWGLNVVERSLLAHIQSYFLVFNLNKKELIGDIISYFKENEILDLNFAKNATYLEPKFYNYMKAKGYTCAAYSNTKLTDIYANPYDCISKYGLPVLKKKCFRSGYCREDILSKTIKYINENKLYNDEIAVPQKYPDAQEYRMGYLKTEINEEELFDFVKEDYFYIFGGGVTAKQLYYTYFEQEPNFKNFVVSKKENNDYTVLNELPIGARIIIAVKDSSQREVEELIKDKYTYIKLWDL